MSTPPPTPDRAKTQLAQLLADTVIAHTPHTSDIQAATTRKHVNQWLEELEAHTAQFVAPFLQNVLDNSDPPEPVRALLAEAIAPSAALSATIEQVFLFNIVGTIVGAAVNPFLYGVSSALAQTAVSAKIVRPVDPAVLATAAGRGFTYPQPSTVSYDPKLADEAAKSSVGPHELDLLASLVGLPPAMQELLEMYRRGIITTAGGAAPGVVTGATPATDHAGNPLTVETGLKEGDFRDDWIGAAVQLAHAFLSPVDFVNAAVREQMDYGEARKWAHTVGLDWNAVVPLTAGAAGQEHDMFGLAYSVAGRPPGPQELAAMTHRKILPATGPNGEDLSFAQGIAESDVKTKWTDSLFKLSTYVPAPEQTMSLLERGGITPDQAAGYWAAHGVPVDVIKALTTIAEQEVHLQDRLEVKAEIKAAYYDGIMSRPDAIVALDLLGYRGPVADDILAIQDFRREIRAIDMVVRRIGTLYQTFKISAVDAMAAMANVGLPLPQAQALLGIWDTLRIAPVRVPTTAEIGRAVKAATITEAEGLAELARLGYQARDAAIVLSSESGAAVVPLPPAGTTTTG